MLFADSQLNIAGAAAVSEYSSSSSLFSGSVSLGGAGRKMYVNDAKTEQISYLPLSDMKLRGKTPDGQLSTSLLLFFNDIFACDHYPFQFRPLYPLYLTVRLDFVTYPTMRV
jgi:hypothetical protein